MFIRSHAAAGATALAATLLASLPAVCAEAPARGVHHFSLGQSPSEQKPGKEPVTENVALSGDQTEGRLTLQDEIWSTTFNVPLHFHKRHAETFYIVSGAVEWTVGGETHVMHAGDLVYIPPNTPHKVHVVGDKPLHTLFFSSPGGYEDQGVIEKAFSKQQLDAPAAKAALATLGDFNPLPNDTAVPPDNEGAGPHRGVHYFALQGHARTSVNRSGNVKSTIAISGDNSEGLYTFQDEIWPADFDVELHYHKRHYEVFYLLGGEIEWTVDGETHLMHAGDVVYIPPNTPHKVFVAGGKPAHIAFIQGSGGYEMAIDLTNEYSKAQLAEPAAKAAMALLHDFNALKDPHPHKTGG